MEFSTPRMRRAAEPALPMINVVFLLLIFFLMSAQIAAPLHGEDLAHIADQSGEHRAFPWVVSLP